MGAATSTLRSKLKREHTKKESPRPNKNKNKNIFEFGGFKLLTKRRKSFNDSIRPTTAATTLTEDSEQKDDTPTRWYRRSSFVAEQHQESQHQEGEGGLLTTPRNKNTPNGRRRRQITRRLSLTDQFTIAMERRKYNATRLPKKQTHSPYKEHHYIMVEPIDPQPTTQCPLDPTNLFLSRFADDT
jgi:hypothetical protein